MKREEVHGNLEGIRDTVIDKLSSLYDYQVDETDFLPRELMAFLSAMSGYLRREIAVYITRDGEIVDVSVGTDRDVELRDYRLRRNAQRLSFVRCVHTHPNGDGTLSDVDISALRSFRYDAMVAVGCLNGEPTVVQAAFLGANDQVILSDLVRWNRLPEQKWLDQIAESDRLVGWEQKELDQGPEKCVLMGIESRESLEELARLAETAGAVVVGSFLQKKDRADTRTTTGRDKGTAAGRDTRAVAEPDTRTAKGRDTETGTEVGTAESGQD